MVKTVYDYSLYEKLRDKEGYTNRKIATKTGISPSTLSDWKNGLYEPKADKIAKLANFFCVPLSYFEDGQFEEKTSTSDKTYYFSDETAEMAQELFENKDMRILFDAAKDSSPEDLQMAATMLKKMKATNPNG